MLLARVSLVAIALSILALAGCGLASGSTRDSTLPTVTRELGGFELQGMRVRFTARKSGEHHYPCEGTYFGPRFPCTDARIEVTIHVDGGAAPYPYDPGWIAGLRIPIADRQEGDEARIDARADELLAALRLRSCVDPTRRLLTLTDARSCRLRAAIRPFHAGQALDLPLATSVATSPMLQPMMSDRDRTLRRFLVAAFGLGLGLQVPALFNPDFLGLGPLVMLTPALAVVIAGPLARQSARALFRRPWPWRWVLAGAVGGMAHKALTIVLALLSGVGHVVDAHVHVEGWRVTRSDLVWLFPEAGEHVVVFALHNALLLITAGAAIGFPFALGEEIAWRGYLLPELERRWGAWRGTLALGLLWAYWHIGFMLAGYNGGGGHAVLNATVMFPLVVTMFGLLLAWLVRSSGSVVPAVVAHGVNNGFPDTEIVEVPVWWQGKVVDLVAAAVVFLVVAVLFGRPPAARYTATVSGAG